MRRREFIAGLGGAAAWPLAPKKGGLNRGRPRPFVVSTINAATKSIKEIGHAG
jgi:hypothetical protein